MIKKLLFGLVCLFPCLSIKAQTESFDYYENGKWGCLFQYYDSQAKEYCSFSVFPQYDATCFVWYNRKNGGYFMAKKNGKWALMNEYNIPVTDFVFEDINSAFDETSESYKGEIVVNKRTDNTGYAENLKLMLSFGTKDPFTEKKEVVFDTKHRNVQDKFIFLNKSSWVAVKKDGKWGYLQLDGTWAIEPVFEEAYAFVMKTKGFGAKETQYAIANVKKDGLWGVIDPTGKVITKFKAKKSMKYNKLEKLCEKLVKKEKLEGFSVPRPKFSPYVCTSEKEVGIIKTSGNMLQLVDAETKEPVTPFLYQRVELVNQDVLKVERNNKWGIVNLNSGEVIPCIFDSIGEFDGNGFAEAETDGRRIGVNMRGWASIVPDDIQSMLKQADKYSRKNDYASAARLLAYAKTVTGAKEDDMFRLKFGSSIAKKYYWAEKYRTGEAVRQPEASGWELLGEIFTTGQELYQTFSGKAEGTYESLTGDSSVGTGINTNSSLQSQYAQWERRAIANYNSLTNTGSRVKKNGNDVKGTNGQSLNSGNYVMQKKALRQAQDEMRKIRSKASKQGISIPQSRYETVTVSY